MNPRHIRTCGDVTAWLSEWARENGEVFHATIQADSVDDAWQWPIIVTPSGIFADPPPFLPSSLVEVQSIALTEALRLQRGEDVGEINAEGME